MRLVDTEIDACLATTYFTPALRYRADHNLSDGRWGRCGRFQSVDGLSRRHVVVKQGQGVVKVASWQLD